VVVLARAEDSVAFILCDGVEPDNGVTPQVVFGFSHNPIFVVLVELVHGYQRLG